ncbi:MULTISPECIES: chromate efflux transporter [Pseudoalteromonas]|uniref:Chorismate-binding protein n=1 Tax=Pseudoalteromonas agarivorans TaxID=176102 RepID=A0ABR5VVQ5_9GAMM|nr:MULTISPECIES: chromate efflux transporter [Pseudoalteromonas]MCP4056858.1 chromate efflux transporter [Pseudoalteromonas sp.]KYL35475.1 chorismate-binding protein [Pseudoalteromonas telluritireducens]MCQ8887184.1 chromate efflux transporter [Pseudoalteromonas agarivorans]MDC9565393.1 chromate efflux transporter [Pseudoalteromonas sp. GAB2316C]MDC9569726.1 chromate efflux transporter [Pseudoalteromonas sp. GABNB9D]
MLVAIFRQFFLLGCMSFGGPAAHLGYFKRHFVDTLNWLSDTRYAQLISLSQALPGPGSSQVGFAIGVERAGVIGGITAFIAFTLPSFLIMLLLAVSAHQFDAVYFAIIAGLKLFAVVIVADATLTMAKSFCTSAALKLIAVMSTLALLLFPLLGTQIAILVSAAAIGAIWPLLQLNTQTEPKADTKSAFRWLPLGLFVLLLAISFIPLGDDLALFAPFYQAGAMVFGGGHVVLPVLQAGVPALSNDQFLSAYASAQAIPGPMFTIATYLGAQLTSEQPLIGAIAATLLIFTPGFLLMLAFQKSWLNLASKPRFASSIAALNAAVVGFLAAALYSPIWTSAVHNLWQVALVIAAFAWLRMKKPPIWWLLALFISVGLVQHYLPLL